MLLLVGTQELNDCLLEAGWIWLALLIWHNVSRKPSCTEQAVSDQGALQLLCIG